MNDGTACSTAPTNAAKLVSTKLLNPHPPSLIGSLKATVENPRGSVEKLSPKESVEGADTVLRGSVRAPRNSPEETVIPLCPKDFQQLLRLPKS